MNIRFMNVIMYLDLDVSELVGCPLDVDNKMVFGFRSRLFSLLFKLMNISSCIQAKWLIRPELMPVSVA